MKKTIYNFSKFKESLVSIYLYYRRLFYIKDSGIFKYLLSILLISLIGVLDASVIVNIGNIINNKNELTIFLKILVFFGIISLPIRILLNNILIKASSNLAITTGKYNLENYIYGSYDFQKKYSGGELANILGEIPNKLNSLVLLPISQLIIAIAITVSLIVSIIYLIGIFALYLLILCLILYMLFNLFTTSLMQKNTGRETKSLSNINEIAVIIDSNLETIKINNLKEDFLNEYNYKNKLTRYSIAKNAQIINFPKQFIDGSIIMFISLSFILTLGEDVIDATYRNLIPTIIAASKLIPSFQSFIRLTGVILSATEILRECQIPESVKTKQKLIKKISFLNKKDFGFHINNINLVNPEGNNLSFIKSHKFKTGCLNFIIGKSGVGKTTFLLALAGLNYKTSGELVINLDNKYKGCPQIFDFCAQKPQIFPGNILKNILLGSDSSIQKINMINRICMSLNLKYDIKNKLSNELSGGEKARLAIARSLFYKRPILMLDEPFSSLDKKNSENLANILREHSKEIIILINTHDISFINKNDTTLEIISN
tara:strand:+ start:16831 stop:18468 length:1638 start_codon:yes stop_codon:yes gene_type:complete